MVFDFQRHKIRQRPKQQLRSVHRVLKMQLRSVHGVLKTQRRVPPMQVQGNIWWAFTILQIIFQHLNPSTVAKSDAMMICGMVLRFIYPLLRACTWYGQLVPISHGRFFCLPRDLWETVRTPPPRPRVAIIVLPKISSTEQLVITQPVRPYKVLLSLIQWHRGEI